MNDEEKEYEEANVYEDKEVLICLPPKVWEILERLAGSYDLELESFIAMTLHCEAEGKRSNRLKSK